MPRNAAEIKENIMRYFRTRGPSIPVHISKHVGMSILFTSAFLSELLSEKQLTLSNMRVGSTPIYLIPGQEPQLERYIEHIKGKEKEALLLLKEKKFLEDLEQSPPIRVALRQIKDFAIPFKHNEQIFWRYFTTSQNEFKIPTQQPEIKEEIKTEVEQVTPSLLTTIKNKFLSPTISEQEPSTKTQYNESPPQIIKSPIETSRGTTDVEPSISRDSEQLKIFDKPKEDERKEKKKSPTKKSLKKKTTTASQKAQEKFFNRVKEFLAEKQAEILEIISATKIDLVLKIKIENKEKILVAYNKKRITEQEIIKAHKKSKEYNLPYLIMSLGEMPKKLNDLLEALKTLGEVEKIA